MLAGRHPAMLLVDFEPDRDTNDPAAMAAALESSGFVAVLTAYRTAALEATANVMLPIAAFTETSGTYVNAQGDRQSFGGIVAPPGDARPAWKVLRVLGNMVDLEGFDYDNSEQIRDEVLGACDAELPAMSAGTGPAERRLASGNLERVGATAPYAMDALSRRAGPLQGTADGRTGMRMNAAMAQQAGVTDGDSATVIQGGGRATMTVVVDAAVPDACVWAPAGAPGCETLGAMFGDVKLEKA